MENFHIPGLEFFDQVSKKNLKYIYPDTNHWTAGWILYKHVDGHWVTWRKATDSDIAAINEAVAKGHHHSP